MLVVNPLSILIPFLALPEGREIRCLRVCLCQTRLFFISTHSEFFLLQGVVEEHEGGLGLAVLGVSEAQIGTLFQGFALENLHLVELVHDKFDKFSGALLKAVDAVFLAVGVQMRDSFLEQRLAHIHSVLL